MATATIGRVHGPHRRTAEPCALCLAAAQPHVPRPRDTRFTPVVDALLPWILSLAFLAPLGFALDGGPRIFVVGLAAGVLVGAAFAWRLHVLDRATGLAATARVRAEISAESDARANSVLMQFEWAVNDIASLRTKLEKAEREVREHAQHAFAAERDVRRLERNLRLRDRRSAVRAVKQAAPVEAPAPAPVDLETIPLHCRLNDRQPLPWLDLGADDADNLPTRVRVFERDGNVICVSDPAIYDGVTRSASLKLPLPPNLAAALRRGVLDDYRFEALVAHRWIGVRLIQATTQVGPDKRGRVYRRA